MIPLSFLLELERFPPSKDIGVGEIVKSFETFFVEPADIETGLVALKNQSAPCPVAIH
jgi:hypothetical protein